MQNVAGATQPSSKPGLRALYKPVLFGLPFLLMVFVLAGQLFAPLRTDQDKEGAFTPTLDPGNGTGQTFQASFSNLRAVTLKFNRADQPGSGGPVQLKLHRDSAAGQVVYETALDNPGNATTLEKRFEIPAQADSAGKSYYLEVAGQAGTNWQLAMSDHNAYREGALFLKGQPTGGDLYFELEYSPDPLELLKHFFQRQEEWGGAPWLAVVLVLATLGWYGFGFVWYARKSTNSSAPFSLRGYVSSNRGFWTVGAFLLVLMALRLLSYSFINPPLQGPDEPGHLGRVISTAAVVPNENLNASVADLMNKTHFPESFPWLTYDDDPIKFYPATAEYYQSGLYYNLAAGVVKVGRLFSQDLVYQIYWARFASVLFTLGTLALVLVASRELLGKSARLALLLPLTLAMLPQVAHIGSVTNNDNAVTFFMAAAALGLLLLFKNGLRWQYFLLLLAGLALGVLAKRTSITVVPGFGVGLYLLAWLKLPSRGRKILLGATGLAVLVGIGAFVWLADFGKAAKGWYVVPSSSGVHAPRASGGGIKLEGLAVEQAVDLFFRGEIPQALVSLKARPLNSNQPGDLKVAVSTYAGTVVEQEFRLQGTDWQELKLSVDLPKGIARVPPGTGRAGLFGYINLSLSAPKEAPVLATQARFVTPDSPDTNLLVNPSFEESTLSPRNDWRGDVPVRTGESTLAKWLDLLGMGSSLDYKAIFLTSLVSVFISWWGAFGWIQVSMSPLWYFFWGVVGAASLVGLILWLRRKQETWKICFGIFCVAAVLSGMLVQQAYMFFTWSYTGNPDVLVGRYIFVALLPSLCLLLVGLYSLSPKFEDRGGTRAIMQNNPPADETPLPPGGNTAIATERDNRKMNNSGGKTGQNLWLWAWCLLLFFFDLSALLATIFPFYYNS